MQRGRVANDAPPWQHLDLVEARQRSKPRREVMEQARNKRRHRKCSKREHGRTLASTSTSTSIHRKGNPKHEETQGQDGTSKAEPRKLESECNPDANSGETNFPDPFLSAHIAIGSEDERLYAGA
ncbi:hypothetical protein K438DRAFT_1835669 [Mycena galopus ATCC 62051]|nr:hypothetical protein K438DRAFT_1835669 [Mycena galopus ATCC 62051]